MIVLKTNGNGNAKKERQQPRFKSFIHLNVYELEEYVAVEAYCPGAVKESLEVAVERNVVSIKAEAPAHDVTGKILLQEFAPSKYERSIKLPVEVDSSKAEASFEEGVLRVSLPKVKPFVRRKIQIV